ncbi:hypothetical protein C4J81_00810 [Deltaproteobacteria bacterium Smac51]|nr:hypothetical protein C4J81_00810 [Deltaproteobacteria bacterium Smac51]
MVQAIQNHSRTGPDRGPGRFRPAHPAVGNGAYRQGGLKPGNPGVSGGAAGLVAGAMNGAAPSGDLPAFTFRKPF